MGRYKVFLIKFNHDLMILSLNVVLSCSFAQQRCLSVIVAEGWMMIHHQYVKNT